MTEKSAFHALVFSKTSGYRHDSIPAGIAAIKGLADRKKTFTIDVSEDAEQSFTSSSLKQYEVVVLLQNTGDFLTPEQIEALREFVRSGGGVVAIHGAAAGLLNDDWYGDLIGAHFDSHPKPEPGTVLVENADHCIMSGVGGRTGWMDEWYNFCTHPRDNKRLNILLKGDTKSFSGGKMGDDHPLSWYQEFDGGRVYFTALGHFDEAYSDEWFVNQIYRAILWTAKRD
jgi:type 1 glutamine amidotransferase